MAKRVILGPQNEPIFIDDDSRAVRGPQNEWIIPAGAKPTVMTPNSVRLTNPKEK